MAVNNKLIEQIFKPVNHDVISNPNPRLASNYAIKKGNLVTFNYSFWKKDPYPLVIISQVLPSNKIFGINLHYLTFNYIKKLLKNCGNPLFSYSNSIKGDNYLKDAYRSYKWSGVRQVKVLNCDFLLNIISTIRNSDPAEVQIIRKNVQEQIRQQINPKSYEVNVKTLNNKDTPQMGTVPTIKTVPVVQNQTE